MSPALQAPATSTSSLRVLLNPQTWVGQGLNSLVRTPKKLIQWQKTKYLGTPEAHKPRDPHSMSSPYCCELPGPRPCWSYTDQGYRRTRRWNKNEVVCCPATGAKGRRCAAWNQSKGQEDILGVVMSAYAYLIILGVDVRASAEASFSNPL